MRFQDVRFKLAGKRNDETPGSRPCEPYHAEKSRSIAMSGQSAQRAPAGPNVPMSTGSAGLREGPASGPGGLLEVGSAVGERHERRLELRGGEEDAAVEHPVEEATVARRVRALG